MQKVEYIKPDPPRFLRDGMQINDVEGARPKKVKELATRESNNVSDIFGASPKKSYVRKTVYNSVNYHDVTKFQPKSKRITDPLNPTYALRDTGSGDFTNPVRGEINNNYGGIDGSKPSTLPKEVAGVRNLATKDISGAQADTKGKGMFTWKQRSEYGPVPKVYDDVDGCAPDTVKKCI